jgi:hypothetical protein
MGNKHDNENLSVALFRMADAIRSVIPLLEVIEKEEAEGKKNQRPKQQQQEDTADWLFNILEPIQSSFETKELLKMVHQASLLEEDQQQDALFSVLGASEEAMTALMHIVPNMKRIQQLQINEDEQAGTNDSMIHEDPLEVERRRLRQEVLDTAQVAALAQAEVDAVQSRSAMSQTATHTIQRTSEIELVKAAKKAHKRAAQALQRAKAAGAVLGQDDMMSINPAATMGQGGLINRSAEELQSLQQSLLPEGSKQYHRDQTLPSGTQRYDDDIIGYERVVIPPPTLNPSTLHPRLRVEDVMDSECAKAFAGTASLNPMQSAVFDVAFHRRENMLVCAPTGAGKTNVALLTVTAHFRDVGLVHSNRNIPNPRNTLEAGSKVVYIAPMKALAQEVVEKFTSKLTPSLKLVVRELTGDMQLTRAEAEAANVIVTTPEKWDVVTRKAGNDENSLGNQCGLLIIDEVHLLADDRGAVIESVVARMHRLVESRQKQQRIVALSATLPNYQDVADFLQVPPRGLFYFGPEHRPVPLEQSFVGGTSPRSVLLTLDFRNAIDIDVSNIVCFLFASFDFAQSLEM